MQAPDLYPRMLNLCRLCWEDGRDFQQPQCRALQKGGFSSLHSPGVGCLPCLSPGSSLGPPRQLFSAPGEEDGRGTLPARGLLSFLVLRPATGKQEDVIISRGCYQMTGFSAEHFFLSLMTAAKRLPGWGGGRSPSFSVMKDFRSIFCGWALLEPNLHSSGGEISSTMYCRAGSGPAPPSGQVLALFPAPLPQTPSAKPTPARLTVPAQPPVPRPFQAQTHHGYWSSVSRSCWAHAARSVCARASICPPVTTLSPLANFNQI